jgi:hypothetical protein
MPRGYKVLLPIDINSKAGANRPAAFNPKDPVDKVRFNHFAPRFSEANRAADPFAGGDSGFP